MATSSLCVHFVCANKSALGCRASIAQETKSHFYYAIQGQFSVIHNTGVAVTITRFHETFDSHKNVEINLNTWIDYFILCIFMFALRVAIDGSKTTTKLELLDLDRAQEKKRSKMVPFTSCLLTHKIFNFLVGRRILSTL